jgi:hypothetical protein
MATFMEALKRMLARPDCQLEPWALVAKRSKRSLESIQLELRSCATRSIPHRAEAPMLTRAEKRKRARAIFAQYPELSCEKVARCVRLGYSEDAMLSLRGAAIGERIRSGRF